jgi:hypothetical protein
MFIWRGWVVEGVVGVLLLRPLEVGDVDVGWLYWIHSLSLCLVIGQAGRAPARVGEEGNGASRIRRVGSTKRA